MRFIATADSDIGISKATNQDSVLIKQAKVDGEEVLLAVICDGMGWLIKRRTRKCNGNPGIC